MSDATGKTAPEPKKRGRPTISGAGVAQQLNTRVPADLLARIDAWAEARKIDRSEAVRRLLTAALDAEGG